MRIDLSADVGESADAAVDAALMRSVTSVSIAAGGHAGDVQSIRAILRLARALGVAAGVHPGFADRQHFGRVDTPVDRLDVQRLVLDQIITVASIAADEGIELQHVKPHGALYNMAARDAALAAAVAGAVAVFDSTLLLFAPPGSRLIEAARARGLGTVAEAFADRAYAADGSLVPRSAAGAVITDPQVVVERALQIVRDGRVIAVDGTFVPLEAATLCVHSDTADAPALAAAVRAALASGGVSIQPPRRL